MAGWTEHRVATLAKLWADGHSASVIASRLGGVTRNAVIGKVHRLGLAGRQTSVWKAKTRPASPRGRRQPTQLSFHLLPPRPHPKPALAPAFEPTPLMLSLERLSAQSCRWPIGDPKEPGFGFCGRHARGRYCQHHEHVGTR